MLTRPVRTEIQGKYNTKYVITDYGPYRTIAIICWRNGAWDLARKIDEYIIWRDPLAPQE